MISRYKPRKMRAAKLVGAPAALLAVYDNGGRSADRYTALYGEPLWDPKYPHTIPARFMSSHPSHPQGIGLFGDVPSNVRGWNSPLGRCVAFADLPEPVRRCIEADCLPDDGTSP